MNNQMTEHKDFIEAYDMKENNNKKIILYTDCFISYEEFNVLKNFNGKYKDCPYKFSNKFYFNPFMELKLQVDDLHEYTHHFSIGEEFFPEYDLEELPELQKKKKYMEKINQKELCKNLNIFLPDFHLIFNIEKDDINEIKDLLEDKYPLIIKKSVDYAGINFQVLREFNQLSDYIENIKQNKPILFSEDLEENNFFIIESYIEGDEFIADFIIHPTQGNILVAYWKSPMNKEIEGKKYAINGSISLPNKDFPKEINKNFKKLFKEMNLAYGFAHCEYRICKKTNKVVLLDLNLRLTGADIGKLYLIYYNDLFLNTIIDCIDNKPVDENIFIGFDQTYIVYKPTIYNFIFSKEDENKKIGCVYINPRELIEEEIKKAEIVSLYSSVGSYFNTFTSYIWINGSVYCSFLRTDMNFEDAEIYYYETIIPTLQKYVIVDFSE